MCVMRAYLCGYIKEIYFLNKTILISDHCKESITNSMNVFSIRIMDYPYFFMHVMKYI